MTTQGVDVIETIEKDVQHLKECMDMIQETVQMQQGSIDSIEDAIQHAKDDAILGQNEVVEAESYQSRYGYVMTLIGSAAVGIAMVVMIL